MQPFWLLNPALKHVCLSSQALDVKSVRLSDYINGEIDLLKLDIEGAEQKVLVELGNKLSLVKELHMEVHESSALKEINQLSSIIEILERHHFIYGKGTSVRDMIEIFLRFHLTF